MIRREEFRQYIIDIPIRMDNRADLCAQHRKGFYLTISEPQRKLQYHGLMVAQRDGTALHKIHPLIAYERMSPVKLFINSALNIQSSPDYSRGCIACDTDGEGEGIFESGFMNSATVSRVSGSDR